MTRETRKIQKVGGSTFSVSLPKSWARERGLSAGSLVTVSAHPDDVLVVEPGEDDGTSERTVTVAHEEPDPLEHAVRAAYAAGIDQLRLEATETLTREQRRAVGRVTEALPGTTVVEEREAHVVVRVLLDGEEVSIQQAVRQLAFVASSMHREALAALAGETPHDALARDAEADRLFALVDRHVQRGLSRTKTVDALGTSRPELAALRATARELRRIAADAARLGAIAAELDAAAGSDVDADATEAGDDAPNGAGATDATDTADGTITPDGAVDPTTLGERARGIVETATEAVVTGAGVDAARSALAGHAALVEDVADAERALRSGDGDYRSSRAVEHCRRTADHGAAIARLAFRGSLRRGEFDQSPATDDPDVLDDPPVGGTLGEPSEDGTLGGAVPAGGEATGTLDAIDDEPTEDGVDAERSDAAPDADG